MTVRFKHSIMILFLLCVLPLACTPPAPTPSITATVPANALIFIAEADAHVRQSNPGKNYGNMPTLRVNGENDAVSESFLRFSVEGVPGRVESALLRVYIPTNGAKDGPAVYATEASWDETGVNWDNRPARTGAAADNKDQLNKGTWAEYNVTPLVTGNGIFSFAFVEDSNSSILFSSREGEQPPQLVITFSASPPTPTAPPTLSSSESGGDAVLVGAGDIADCGGTQDERTAELLDAIPGTVFTTGDNVYENGTLNEYRDCYGPSWGRHKDRTRPVPGNHEYETPGASGYFQYFDNIPSYYAYDLGQWRIYALNSEIDVSADSPQVAWLQADLEANPRQCVLAYWHQPRWSSGTHHGNNRDVQTLWRVLYKAGAEVVLHGHEHNYERFTPMNAAGEPDPRGMRSFVVGTGGKSLYEIESPLPTSEVHNDFAYGVLKLTLRETSYEWEFIPIPGSIFTDRGSTDCH